MTIHDVFQKHSGVISICMVDDEEGTKELKEFHKEFNEKFNIVPKEQWCVTITVGESINSTQVIGPFESKEISELFANIWNRKRDEFIDKTIEENPDDEFDFPYLKAKPTKINWDNECEEISKEIFEHLGKL